MKSFGNSYTQAFWSEQEVHKQSLRWNWRAPSKEVSLTLVKYLFLDFYIFFLYFAEYHLSLCIVTRQNIAKLFWTLSNHLATSTLTLLPPDALVTWRSCDLVIMSRDTTLQSCDINDRNVPLSLVTTKFAVYYICTVHFNWLDLKPFMLIVRYTSMVLV